MPAVHSTLTPSQPVGDSVPVPSPITPAVHSAILTPTSSSLAPIQLIVFECESFEELVYSYTPPPLPSPIHDYTTIQSSSDNKLLWENIKSLSDRVDKIQNDITELIMDKVLFMDSLLISNLPQTNHQHYLNHYHSHYLLNHHQLHHNRYFFTTSK